jgi:hypothetical protein
MKQLAANYSISGSTVTLTGVNVPLNQILLVSNATTGAVLYSMAGPSPTGYTQAANSVITLASAPAGTDRLTIYYDDGLPEDGTDNTGVTQPSGGAGERGWLSGIYSSTLTLLQRIPTLGGALAASCQPVLMPRKQSVAGFASIATGTTYNNILDSTNSGVNIDVRDFNTLSFVITSTATTGVITAFGADNAAMTQFATTLPMRNSAAIAQSAAPLQSFTLTNAVTRFQVDVSGVNYVRIGLTTGMTTGTLTAVGILHHTPIPGVGLQNIHAASGSIGVNIASVVNLTNPANGSTDRMLGTYTAGPVIRTENNAVALTAGASGNLGLQADTTGSGTSTGFTINLSALVLGSATGIYFALKEATDNGSAMFRTIWQTEVLTAAGFLVIPALPIHGRHRIDWYTTNNVALTSGTVTVTANNLSGLTTRQGQFFDRGPLTLAGHVNAFSPASTLSLTTVNSATAGVMIEGFKNLKIAIRVSSQSGTTTTAPVLTLQVSDDYQNWADTPVTLTGPLVAGTVAAFAGNVSARYARLVTTTAQAGAATYVLGYASIYGTN